MLKSDLIRAMTEQGVAPADIGVLTQNTPEDGTDLVMAQSLVDAMNIRGGYDLPAGVNRWIAAALCPVPDDVDTALAAADMAKALSDDEKALAAWESASPETLAKAREAATKRGDDWDSLTMIAQGLLIIALMTSDGLTPPTDPAPQPITGSDDGTSPGNQNSPATDGTDEAAENARQEMNEH